MREKRFFPRRGLGVREFLTLALLFKVWQSGKKNRLNLDSLLRAGYSSELGKTTLIPQLVTIKEESKDRRPGALLF